MWGEVVLRPHATEVGSHSISWTNFAPAFECPIYSTNVRYAQLVVELPGNSSLSNFWELENQDLNDKLKEPLIKWHSVPSAVADGHHSTPLDAGVETGHPLPRMVLNGLVTCSELP